MAQILVKFDGIHDYEQVIKNITEQLEENPNLGIMKKTNKGHEVIWNDTMLLPDED